MVEDEPAESEEIEQPIILESAHRHGVSEEDMLQALRFAIHHVRQDDDMVMFIRHDASGSELVEVRVVIWWGGELAIAHAMRPARDKYRR
jgi:hypothetical protein